MAELITFTPPTPDTIDLTALLKSGRKLKAGLISPSDEEVETELASEHDAALVEAAVRVPEPERAHRSHREAVLHRHFSDTCFLKQYPVFGFHAFTSPCLAGRRIRRPARLHHFTKYI